MGGDEVPVGAGAEGAVDEEDGGWVGWVVGLEV